MSKSILDALRTFGKDTGEYWSNDNSQFEQKNPTTLDRLGRAVNPMTAFGSALGAMHDGANIGSNSDMALALLQALPLFGATKLVALPAKGVLKTSARVVPSLQKTAQMTLGNSLISAGIDETQANKRNNHE